MALFKYKAIDDFGVMKSETIESQDRKSAVMELSMRKLKVIDIRLLNESAEIEVEKSKKISGGNKLSLTFFYKIRQLAAGGMPIGDAVRGLSQRSLDKNLRTLSRELYKDLSEGKTLSFALSKFSENFDPTIVHLLEAGEATANLIPIFDNIIDYLEKKRELQSKLISATAYPAFLCVMAFAVVLFFLFFMLPQIETMMKNLGGEMTLPVKILMGLGDFLIIYAPFVFGALIIFIIALTQYRKSKKGLLVSDRVYLSIPLIGKIIQDADICRMTGLCSTLFDSGVNTTETLKFAEKTLSNADIRNRFQSCRTMINDGAPISATFKKFDILNDEDIDILLVGERTASLVNSFSELRKSHYVNLNARIKFATTVLASTALGSAFFLVFLIALGIVSSVLNLSQGLLAK